MPTHTVTPIALRQSHSDVTNHPLQPLVSVKERIREEATKQVEEFSKAIVILLDIMRERDDLVATMGDCDVAVMPKEVLERHLHLNVRVLP